MEKLIIEKLKTNKQTIAVAESLTGGMAAGRFVNISGASNVFKGGIVAYMLEMKETLLNIPLTHTSKTDGVDETTAILMAKNVSKIMKSDYGLSTTGIAESWDDRDEQAFICVYDRINDLHYVEHIHFDTPKNKDTRQYVREQTVDALLSLFAKHI